MSQLRALEQSFEVVTPEGTRLVHYGVSPPSDRNLPWQLTLNDSVTPAGSVMYFVSGKWQTQ